MTITYWNRLKKPNEEVNCKAVKGDMVFEIGGIIYLVQRKNDCNNIVCFRYRKSAMTLLQSFLLCRHRLIDCGIQYVRVEGNISRYLFLEKLQKETGQGSGIVREQNNERNVYYIRLYG